jgi:hypothetical protein
LCHDGIIILEGDEIIFILHETREGIAKNTERSLSIIDVRSAITENRIELFDRNITVFGGSGGVNPSGEKSSLNNILQWLTEKASECVGTILTDRIHRDCVVLVVEIGNRLSGRRDESHL